MGVLRTERRLGQTLILKSREGEDDRIAVVTDHPWVRAVVGMFMTLYRGEVRLFTLAVLAPAKAWIADGAPPNPG